MDKVYACIDAAPGSGAVIDWAAWSALRLGAPLELLHALERPPGQTPATDLSGAIGLGSQDELLQQLSALDEQRGKLAQQAGRQLLAAARQRAADAGVAQPDARLRHGELLDAVLEMETDARLFVLGAGRRGGEADKSPARLHLDHRVERVIRAVKRPVLVVPGDGFAPPTRFAFAWDGSPTARAAVERVARSPLLQGLSAVVVTAGTDETPARRLINEAQALLADAGFAATAAFVQGEPEVVLPGFVERQGAQLLVMGAYGHSRLRSLIMGSTTTGVLRASAVPVLILR